MKIEFFFKFVKDILFPIFCVECGKEGEWWCDECLNRRNFPPVLKCPGCEAETAEGRICPACIFGCPLDGAVALAIYDEGQPLAKLVQAFKYQYAEETLAVWRKIFQKILGDACRLPPPLQGGGEGAVFIPVPLHPRRERERGFNQAALLARVFVEEIKKFRLIGGQAAGGRVELLENALLRRRYTSQQARLSKKERAKNMSGAFVWAGQSPCPEKVWLVDDVFTTGATLRECAAVLKSVGAKEVWALTLGRVI